MSGSPGGALPQTQINILNVGGEAVVPIQPQEMCYPLRRDTFELLCETETINDDKKYRDLAVAVFFTALVGYIGLAACPEMATTTDQRITSALRFFLAVLTVASLAVAAIQALKVWKKPESTGYARSKTKIVKWYQDNNVT
jgi:hypothetical protein